MTREPGSATPPRRQGVRTIRRVALAAFMSVAAGASFAQAGVADDRAASAVRRGAECRPAYPAAALKARAEGVTQLHMRIDAAGVITSADVVTSAGPTPEHRLLDQAAASAVVGCSLFRPDYDAHGNPIARDVTLGYHWGLPPIDGSASKAHPPRLVAVDAACRPVYPPAAIRAGAQGKTVVDLVVDAAGHAGHARVVRSAGDSAELKLLDQAAAEALARCPYTPGTDADGKPVGATVSVSYEWRLD